MTQSEQLAAAHVLLDAVSAFDHGQGETPQNEAAVKLALDRLSEIGSIRVIEQDDGTIVLDPSPLVSGAIVTITLLARTLAEKYNADYDAVTATIREQLTEILQG
ncbi:hypothetical protein NSZ01_05050 [Nocardioides szechwanensis]|uniref:Uncharacterized protein n=1 Tax=Nocardioides szechwanensis TaxID=1005944 RepID=A0A1G9W658_9ACTN|nr:hypothetical protein [Nocardioides szechwanensis]GEP32737.1 hypothetical protein NSZ01_05050 [Nocardioides szechwanensis]SDM79706.1 hypothetical protein SAMN05192576_0952 [Nocardioides szechwanensis]